MAPSDLVAPGSLLDEGLCAFVAGGVSIGIATRDAAMRPHVVRAVGGRLDGAGLVLFVPRGQAQAALADIAANGRVAVVFSQPSTHRTVQLKARDARCVALQPGDPAFVKAYREALLRDLASIGYAPAFVDALLAGIDEELVAIAFTPDEGYDATPGPQAGAPLGAAR